MRKFKILFSFMMLQLTNNTVAQLKNENTNCVVDKNKTIKIMEKQHKNVLGESLSIASTNPMTGFYRNGYCMTDTNDIGSHVIAAVITEDFLNYTLSKGNDLISPNKSHDFPGLKAGDVWCLCALRWKEALKAKAAPKVILEATHIKALKYITLEELKKHENK